MPDNHVLLRRFLLHDDATLPRCHPHVLQHPSLHSAHEADISEQDGSVRPSQQAERPDVHAAGHLSGAAPHAYRRDGAPAASREVLGQNVEDAKRVRVFIRPYMQYSCVITDTLDIADETLLSLLCVYSEICPSLKTTLRLLVPSFCHQFHLTTMACHRSYSR